MLRKVVPLKSGPELAAMACAEYREMPGVCLTLAQAARLWNADRRVCEDVLQQLVAGGFLRRVGSTYARADRVPRSA